MKAANQSINLPRKIGQIGLFVAASSLLALTACQKSRFSRVEAPSAKQEPHRQRRVFDPVGPDSGFGGTRPDPTSRPRPRPNPPAVDSEDPRVVITVPIPEQPTQPTYPPVNPPKTVGWFPPVADGPTIVINEPEPAPQPPQVEVSDPEPTIIPREPRPVTRPTENEPRVVQPTRQPEPPPTIVLPPRSEPEITRREAPTPLPAVPSDPPARALQQPPVAQGPSHFAPTSTNIPLARYAAEPDVTQEARMAPVLNKPSVETEESITDSVANRSDLPIVQASYQPPTTMESPVTPEPITFPVSYTSTQPVELITDKLQIVFILDVSASIKQEMSHMVEEIKTFVKQLPPGIDVSVGVMGGYSPDSHGGSLTGYLVAGETGLAVLKGRTGRDDFESLGQQLAEKILNMPKDQTKAHGEMGLLSLYRALTGPDQIAALQEQGMLTEDAAWAFIFGADENDLCYQYKEGEQPALTKDGEVDPDELLESVQKHCVVHTEHGEEHLTPELVYQALLDRRPDTTKHPLILTGVMYVDQKTVDFVRENSGDAYATENELGRGYIDLITDLHKSHAIDLHQNFASSLGFIGQMSRVTMSMHTRVRIDDKIDPLSIMVSIDGHQLSSDVWDYDDRTKQIVIAHSALLEYSKPGSELEIKARRFGQPD